VLQKYTLYFYRIISAKVLEARKSYSMMITALLPQVFNFKIESRFLMYESFRTTTDEEKGLGDIAKPSSSHIFLIKRNKN